MNPIIIEYAKKGFRLFPCHSIKEGKCTCAKGAHCESPGKHPRTYDGVKGATSDITTLESWFTQWPDANIALACGVQSGVFVVDIDQKHGGFESIEEFESMREAGPLPETLTAVSGGGGKHFVFAYPTDGHPLRNRNPWLPGIDVKSDGGYVIVEPSNHISGGSYHWIDWSTPIVEAPPDLLSSIRSGGRSGTKGGDLPDNQSFLQGVPEGKRDDTIFRKACQLRRKFKDDSDGGYSSVLAICLAAAAACDPPFPEADARKKVEQAFAQDHDDDNISWMYLDDRGEDLEHLTDMGNRNRFLKRYRDSLRYVPEWGWLKWGSIGWQPVSVEHIYRLIEEVPAMVAAEMSHIVDPAKLKRWANWSMQSESNSRIKNVEFLARQDEVVLKSSEEFDFDKTKIACRNGILDIKTGTLKDFDRSDLVTKNTHVEFDPDFRLEAWERFLKTSVPDEEVRDWLQEMAGYMLTGLVTEESFYILSGPAASGKSTFVDAIMGAMGTYAVTVQPDIFMWRRGRETPKDELARLDGTRLVSSSEIREGERFNESLIKQITGGDKIAARFLYKDGFDYLPQFKLIISTNHDPLAQDEAILRRLKRIPFTQSIAKDQRDPQLKLTLKNPDIGGKAVLAWAVKGAQRFFERGRLETPKMVVDAIEAYAEEQDMFAQFSAECLLPAIDVMTSVQALYSAYVTWCDTVKEFPVRRSVFIAKMEERGYNRAIDTSGKKYNFFTDVTPKSPVLSENGLIWT